MAAQKDIEIANTAFSYCCFKLVAL